MEQESTGSNLTADIINVTNLISVKSRRGLIFVLNMCCFVENSFVTILDPFEQEYVAKRIIVLFTLDT